MKLPSIDECNSIIKKYGMPRNIELHTQKVRGVANFLAKKILEKRFVDLDVVDRGALMHDFMKMYCIENDCRHAAEAGRVMASLGYPVFGEILKLHGLEEVLNFDANVSIEAKIVWYADKRVNHDKVVLLSERYAYLKERYGSKSTEKMNQIISTEKPAFDLEKELLSLANVSEKLGEFNG